MIVFLTNLGDQKMKQYILVIVLLLILVACGPTETVEIQPGQVAWKVTGDNATETVTSGAVSLLDYTISDSLGLPAGKIATDSDGTVYGPGGRYPDVPNPTAEQGVGTLAITNAFCIDDSSHIGIIGTQSKTANGEVSPNEMDAQVLRVPGCYPYPEGYVKRYPTGIVTMRTQTTNKYESGVTGLEVCQSDPAGYICDGSVTKLVLDTDDPDVMGTIDVDITGRWLFNSPERLLEDAGNPEAYLKTMVINEIRSMRGVLASEYAPADFKYSAEAEQAMISVMLERVTTSLAEDGLFEVDKIQIRGRDFNVTAMQAAEAAHQANLQEWENQNAITTAELAAAAASLDAETANQLAEITAAEELELAKIASELTISTARQEAEAAQLEWEREQFVLSQTGFEYLSCVRSLYSLQDSAESGQKTSGPSSDEMQTLIIGCMPDANVRALNDSGSSIESVTINSSSSATE